MSRRWALKRRHSAVVSTASRRGTCYSDECDATDGMTPGRSTVSLYLVGLSVGLVALLLLHRAGSRNAARREPVAAADPRFPDYVASLVGAPVEQGDAYTVLRNGDEVYPADARGDRQAKSRINFESYVYKDGEIGDRFVDALARAAERGVTCASCSIRSGRRSMSKNRERLTKAGAKLAWFNPIGLDRRRGELPHASQDAGRRRRRRVHGRHGHRRPLAGPRAGQGALARHAVPNHRAGGARARRRRSTRTGSRPAACRRRRSIRRCRRGRPARARSWSGAIRCPAPATSSCMYLLAIGAARKTIDIQSPYITLEVDAVEPRGGAPARRPRPHAGRRRGHRRDAGEARQPLRLSGAARQRHRDLEYQPTMMHVKAMVVDGVLSIIGSANFGNRSFELNDELAVGVVDPELAARAHQGLQARPQASKRLDKETWKQAALLRRQAERVVLGASSARSSSLDLVLHERGERFERLLGRPRCCQAPCVTRSRHRSPVRRSRSARAQALVAERRRCSPRCARTIGCRSSRCRPSTRDRRRS